MANVKHGNTIYIDATGDVTSNKTHVYQVLVSATAANAQVVLGNIGASEKQLDLRVATDGDTKSFEFVVPVMFPDGVEVITLTNAIVTLVYNIR